MKGMNNIIFGTVMLLVASGANAGLIATLSGKVGDGQSTISLPGSSIVATGSGTISTGTGDVGACFSFGDYIKTIDNTHISLTGGAASIGVNGSFASIDSIYLDQDGDGLDDWGVGISGSDLPFVTDDTISWFGSV